MRMLSQLLMGLGFLGAALIAGPAAANTISISSCMSGICGTASDGGAAVTFQGFLSNGTLSSTNANTFANIGGNSNEATEAAFLNGLAGTSFTGSSTTNIVQPSGATTGTFSVPAMAYFLLKLDGPNGGWAFFQNVIASAINVTYTADADGKANGFSHYAVFASVPLPTALVFLGSGLLALGGLGLRRKRTLATA